jgi:hypothetical protein
MPIEIFTDDGDEKLPGGNLPGINGNTGKSAPLVPRKESAAGSLKDPGNGPKVL